jgi:hypothetical protein
MAEFSSSLHQNGGYGTKIRIWLVGLSVKRPFGCNHSLSVLSYWTREACCTPRVLAVVGRSARNHDHQSGRAPSSGGNGCSDTSHDGIAQRYQRLSMRVVRAGKPSYPGWVSTSRLAQCWRSSRAVLVSNQPNVGYAPAIANRGVGLSLTDLSVGPTRSACRLGVVRPRAETRPRGCQTEDGVPRHGRLGKAKYLACVVGSVHVLPPRARWVVHCSASRYIGCGYRAANRSLQWRSAKPLSRE